jgi:hypothetical protein
LYHHPSRQTKGQPVVPGWCWQLVARLDIGRDSWTWPMSWVRIDPRHDAAGVTIGQVREVAAGLDGSGPVPWFCSGAGSAYDPATLAHGLAGDRVQMLIRLRNPGRIRRDFPRIRRTLPAVATAKTLPARPRPAQRHHQPTRPATPRD